jgi:hypothetical protein
MNYLTPEPASLPSRYHRAFAKYGTQAIWNKRLLDAPTPEDALVVARRLAEQIERACHAAL